MTVLQQLLDEYLATRRALGVRLERDGRQLQGFVAFLELHQASHITTARALQWATKPRGVQSCRHAQLLGKVRQFARYASAVDPRHEIPPPGLLPARPRRAVPYIYSDLEVDRLIGAARELSGTTGLRPCTFATLLALLAATGMRATEPLRLDRGDVDLDQGVLTVRKSKFGKSRYVPVHPSTSRALADYAALRDRLCPNPLSQRFFLAERGTRIPYSTLRQTFARLCQQVGLRGRADFRPPRLHDLRHRFAVSTLLRWYQDGSDVECHLPVLATYLGHADVKDTYWYCTATPELLQLAADRIEHAPRRLPA
jgi:integrase